MAKRKKSRIYWRDQGGVRRAYIDLRDLGGPQRVALIPRGEKRATTDPDIAAELAAQLVREREEKAPAEGAGRRRGGRYARTFRRATPPAESA